MADVTATVRTVKDGHVYNIGDTIPDMGSIFCVGWEGNVYSFEGKLHSDVSKLPTWVGAGSQCLFYDNASFYKFDGTSWGEVGGN